MRVLAAALAMLALAGCSTDADRAEPRDRSEPVRTAPRSEPALREARCPPDLSNCRSASGRILYVERVDPDGDGDLHVVVADRHGVTLAGVTSIDVAKDLRPRRDPRIGDEAAAMGPVQTGSYGQSQIHALRFAVGR